MKPFSTHWRFHHVAVAVRNMDRALLTYRLLGYNTGDVVQDPLQNVLLAMCERDNVLIELVAAVDEKSPVNSFLKAIGPGPYHTCYVCSDLEATVQNMKEAGLRFRTLSPAKPAVLFGGARVMFLHIPEIGIVELLEES